MYVERWLKAGAMQQDGTSKATLTGTPVSYTHLRAHETVLDLVCRLLLEKKNKNKEKNNTYTETGRVTKTIYSEIITHLPLVSYIIKS